MAALEETFERFTIENKLRAPLLSTADYAELALYLYKQHRQSLDADYEIVRALGSCRAFSYPYEHESEEVVDWCHVTFTAISRNSDCIDDTVLFFVELTDFSCGDQLTLNCFRISKPDAPGLTKGCRYCPPDEDHLHIPGAHFAGQWDYKPTNDTSQEEMAVRFQRQVISRRKNKYFNPDFRPRLWPPPVKPDSSCFCPMLSDNEYASLALSNISRLEGVEYELVYILYSHHVESVQGIYGYGHWCHVCFYAKPKYNEDISLDVYPVHFFAELNDPGLRKYSFTSYSRMDPNGALEGCGICPEKYPHPHIGSYIAGREIVI